jgi:hypothetical protein
MSNEDIRQALGDDIMADYDVDRTVKQALHLAQGFCSYVHTVVGPHEGCGEWAPPEEHSCQDRASFIVLLEEHSQELGLDYVAHQMCVEHAAQAKSHPRDATDWFTYIGEVTIISATQRGSTS